MWTSSGPKCSQHNITKNSLKKKKRSSKFLWKRGKTKHKWFKRAEKCFEERIMSKFFYCNLFLHHIFVILYPLWRNVSHDHNIIKFVCTVDKAQCSCISLSLSWSYNEVEYYTCYDLYLKYPLNFSCLWTANESWWSTLTSSFS